MVKRRKLKADRKEDRIILRCTVAQKETLATAAALRGMGVSTWLLSLGLEQAARTPGRPSP